jgi:hypothetical protein
MEKKMVTQSRARERLSALISRGKEQGQALLEHLRTNPVEDYKVPHMRIHHTTYAERLHLSFDGGQTEREVHPHALNQMYQKTGIPKKYADILLREGQADLLAYNLNRRFRSMQPNKRGEVPNFLLRTVGGQVRGFLSDRYRRWGSREIVEAFAGVAERCKALPISALVTDTRLYIKVVLDKVFEAGKDLFVYGVCLQHSDFGDGALSMKACLTRLVCDNGMLGEDGLRRIHLGARIGDDLQLSERTYQLDTDTMASAVSDVARHLLQEKLASSKLFAVERASERVIDAEERLEVLRRNAYISKGEKEGISDLYRSAEVVKLPPGNTEWRLANAVSLFAHDVEPIRSMELEGLAGAIVGLVS